MGYPPPPPPPGQPGGYGPPPGAPGAPGYGPPTGPPPGGGYGGPPQGPPPGGGYGGPPNGPGGPGGYAPQPPSGGGGSKTSLIVLMAAIVVVVLLAVVGGLILFTRSDDDTVELTEAQRTEALLTEGDVGGAFAEGTADDDEDQPEGEGKCQDTLAELAADGSGPFSNEDLPPGGVERHFEVEDSGATIDHDIAPSVDAVSDYEKFADDCQELTFTDDTGTATFTVTKRDAPDVGDESVAIGIRVSAESDGQTIEIEGVVVVWTRDGNDSIIAYLAGLDPDAFEESGTFEALPIDEDLLDTLVTKADDKLTEVIDQA